ncbi:MAG: ABC transporter permease [Anaerolineae bacterium]|nr:ABC transporter permease [Anaerolineae bacterium]
MIERLHFAFSYALRNMLRDRKRSTFTILSVVVGIATVVALRVLGLMITDALTSNAQAFVRGDIQAIGPANFSIGLLNLDGDSYPFTQRNSPAIMDWAEERGYEITFVTNSELMQAAVVEDGRAGTPALSLGYFIDPAVYPFYNTLRAEEPSGVLLADLFTGPNQVVLGRRLAEQIGASVGDVIRIGAADNLHTVTGIMPDSAETTFDGPQSLFFSFVYLDRAELPDFGLSEVADRAYLKLPPEADQAVIEREIRAEWPRSENQGYLRVNTADEMLADNQQLADMLSRFVMILSLVGLVIGGVGILNTMLVAVNRRAGEIAVLKTLGLQGGDISLVFVAEAVLSGLVGSVLGVGLGFGLSYIARNLAQRVYAVALPWQFYLDPLVLGVVLGVVTTIFFSFLPTITAARIRPNLVLRQEPGGLVRAGKRWIALSLALLIVGFGLLIDLIIGDLSSFINVPGILTPGIVFTLGVFIVIMLMLLVSWILVWLLGKLPAFRNPSLQIAIRGLTLHRSRTALAMLSLIVGMVALSGTLIMTRSITLLLSTSVSEPLGGNVIILPLPLVQEVVHNRLDALDGVNGYRDIKFSTSMSLESINGERRYADWFDYEDPQAALRSAQIETVMGIQVYGDPQRGELVAGRYLTSEDAGQPLITIPYLSEWDANGVGVGSTFTYRLDGGQRTFEVVGVVAPSASSGLIPVSLNDSAVQAPLEMVASDLPFNLIIVDARQEAINDVMASVAAVPGVFVFDISLFDSMLNRMLSQMVALPLLVAVLSLFAAAALIATTVALSTMERQRQIAMLKAIGVSRWQALGQLLAENGIVGVAGGLLSLLPTLLILGLVPALTMGVVRLPVPWDLVGLMLALSIIVTLGATLVTAWGASGEKPLAALRHE